MIVKIHYSGTTSYAITYHNTGFFAHFSVCILAVLWPQRCQTSFAKYYLIRFNTSLMCTRA